MADDGRGRAELAFLTARLAELREELQRNEAELGMPVDGAAASQIIAEVANVLRHAGKAALATQYESAVGQAMWCITHLQRLTEQGADERAIVAAREGQDDAIEALERIDSEVEAFFDDQMKKGEA